MNYPKNWEEFFKQEINKNYFKSLISFVENEYKTKTVYPKQEDVFKVLELINPQDVKVVILGQDPYHEPNQAMGIAFSSLDKTTPRSLANMYKELKDDLGIDHTQTNDLTGWVKQGILLLNTILTVEEHKPLSHGNKGWEEFTLHLLEFLYLRNPKIVFVAFGNNAFKMYSRIKDIKQTNILKFGHPSPLSYFKYFKGTKPFSKINQKLISENVKPIDWSK